MIDTLVFDMGGVLIRWDPAGIVARLGVTGDDAALLEREVFGDREWVALDRGTMRAEEALAAFRSRLPERLWTAAERCLTWWRDPFWPVPGMEALLREVSALGLGIYLLSNATAALHGYFPRIPGADCFAGGVVSADWKLLKPQHEIYETLYAHCRLDPGRCFFVDDSPANVEGAERTGMAGTVFDGDMARLRRTLRQAGVPVEA